MATHSSSLAWRIPWTEEPGRLQSTGFQRVEHYWSDLACMLLLWMRLSTCLFFLCFFHLLLHVITTHDDYTKPIEPLLWARYFTHNRIFRTVISLQMKMLRLWTAYHDQKGSRGYVVVENVNTVFSLKASGLLFLLKKKIVFSVLEIHDQFFKYIFNYSSVKLKNTTSNL